MKERIFALLNSSKYSSIPTTNYLSQLIKELSKRKKCSFNVIVYGLHESSLTFTVDRIAEDSENFSYTIHPLSMTLPGNLKLFRVGQLNTERSRSLKVIYPA